jgi:hypothetical protein
MISFTISDKSEKILNEWLTEHKNTCKFWQLDEDGCPQQGCIGGALTFKFTDTTVSQEQVAVCACGISKNLREWSMRAWLDQLREDRKKRLESK